MVVVEVEDTKIATKDKSLRTYLEIALRSKKELEDEVSDLNDELMSISNVYFKRKK